MGGPPQAPPAAPPAAAATKADNVTFVNKFLIAPLTFLTFLLSLLLISERNDHARRQRHLPHSSTSPAPLTTRLKTTIESWIWRPANGDNNGRKGSKHPYEWVDGVTARSTGSLGEERRGVGDGKLRREESGGSGKGEGGGEEEWYMHTKQREMMKMEVADAVVLRKRVVVVVVVLGTGSVVAVVGGLGWGVWRWIL